MLVRCWGSRGSVSVSGEEYLKYGGDTTCIEIESDAGELIVIDAGTGIRLLGNRLLKEKDGRPINMVLTHAHWDHLAGFPFFKPIYMKKSQVLIHGLKTTRESLKNIISKTMTSPYFPIEFEDINADIQLFESESSHFMIDSVKVDTIALSHPNRGLGYKLSENGKSFVFLTDNELTYRHTDGLAIEDYIEFSRDADLLIHDAEYTAEEYKLTRTWGHSVYTDALDLAIRAGVKSFGLFHLNQDRTDDQADEMLADCKRIIKEKGASLDCFIVGKGTEIKL